MVSDIWQRTNQIAKERKPAAARWAILSNYKQGFFYMYHPIDRITHTIAFVTPVMEHWLKREMGSL